MKAEKLLQMIPLLIITLGIPNLSVSQITGPTSNLCPGVLYTYTSPAGCSNPYGWTCANCVSGTLNSAYNIINIGTNSDGTVFATVAWNNEAMGTISNICGSLTVFPNSIQITAPSPICSSETFSATLINPTSNPSITWSSDNAGLAIDPSTGVANRVNSFNENATVTATYTCGANSTSSENFTVWVGLPSFTSSTPIVGASQITEGYSANYSMYDNNGNKHVSGETSYSWSVQSNWSIFGTPTEQTCEVIATAPAATKTLVFTASNVCGTVDALKSTPLAQVWAVRWHELTCAYYLVSFQTCPYSYWDCCLNLSCVVCQGSRETADILGASVLRNTCARWGKFKLSHLPVYG